MENGDEETPNIDGVDRGRVEATLTVNLLPAAMRALEESQRVLGLSQVDTLNRAIQIQCYALMAAGASYGARMTVDLLGDGTMYEITVIPAPVATPDSTRILRSEARDWA